MKIVLHGAGGKLGYEVSKAAKELGYEIVAVDKTGVSAEEKTYSALGEYRGAADVVIDFSSHLSTKDLLAYVTERKLPLVLATTGQTEEEKAAVYEAAKIVPLFFSANMSYGVALLLSLVKKAAALLQEDDAEIVEFHHNRKVDAPSGTALMIAEAVKSARGEGEIVKGRSGLGKREKGDIGVSAVRLGNVVGKHEVYFSDGMETITLTHEAHDRALFAKGALRAAEYLIGKEPGLYTMQDLVEEKNA